MSPIGPHRRGGENVEAEVPVETEDGVEGAQEEVAARNEAPRMSRACRQLPAEAAEASDTAETEQGKGRTTASPYERGAKLTRAERREIENTSKRCAARSRRRLFDKSSKVMAMPMVQALNMTTSWCAWRGQARRPASAVSLPHQPGTARFAPCPGAMVGSEVKSLTMSQ